MKPKQTMANGFMMKLAKEEADRLMLPLRCMFVTYGHQKNITAVSARLGRARLFRRLRANGYSYPAIAKEFGMDHTSVLYAIRQETVWENDLVGVRRKAAEANIAAAQKAKGKLKPSSRLTYWL